MRLKFSSLLLYASAFITAFAFVKLYHQLYPRYAANYRGTDGKLKMFDLEYMMAQPRDVADNEKNGKTEADEYMGSQRIDDKYIELQHKLLEAYRNLQMHDRIRGENTGLDNTVKGNGNLLLNQNSGVGDTASPKTIDVHINSLQQRDSGSNIGLQETVQGNENLPLQNNYEGNIGFLKKVAVNSDVQLKNNYDGIKQTVEEKSTMLHQNDGLDSTGNQEAIDVNGLDSTGNQEAIDVTDNPLIQNNYEEMNDEHSDTDIDEAWQNEMTSNVHSHLSQNTNIENQESHIIHNMGNDNDMYVSEQNDNSDVTASNDNEFEAMSQQDNDENWDQADNNVIYPITDDHLVHIILAADLRNFAGAPTVLNSILTNAGNPENIRIHFVVCGETKESLLEYLQCHGLVLPEFMIEIVEFDGSILDPDIHQMWENSYYIIRLKSACNYARVYFYRLFPHLSNAIYLDMDLVVQAPIEELWYEALAINETFLAVNNHRSYADEEFNLPAVSQLFEERYGVPFNASAPIFNCGVFFIDLDVYRQYSLYNEIEYWMKLNAKRPRSDKLWLWDAQAVLQLIFNGQSKFLDRKWNVEYMGAPGVEMNDSRRRRISKAGILHWTGTAKPFLPEGINKEYWYPYTPDQCSGHGHCVHSSQLRDDGANYIWICLCQSGYHGN